jgi:hypothetical protein
MSNNSSLSREHFWETIYEVWNIQDWKGESEQEYRYFENTFMILYFQCQFIADKNILYQKDI